MTVAVVQGNSDRYICLLLVGKIQPVVTLPFPCDGEPYTTVLRPVGPMQGLRAQVVDHAGLDAMS